MITIDALGVRGSISAGLPKATIWSVERTIFWVLV